jgi:hypothetical protein
MCEWLLRRVSDHAISFLKHSRKLILSLYDHDRQVGSSCYKANPYCNCKSNVMYNSLLYLTRRQGGIQCNNSAIIGAVCGGFGAYMNDKEIPANGLDVGRDYCLSGKFSLHRQGKQRDDVCTCLLQENSS